MLERFQQQLAGVVFGLVQWCFCRTILDNGLDRLHMWKRSVEECVRPSFARFLCDYTGVGHVLDKERYEGVAEAT